MSEVQKTTLLSMAMTQLDMAAAMIERDDKGGAVNQITEAMGNIEEAYTRQMTDDDK